MISFNSLISGFESLPRIFIILCLSIVLTWSITIQPIFLSCLTSILVGYFLEVVVIGAGVSGLAVAYEIAERLIADVIREEDR